MYSYGPPHMAKQKQNMYLLTPGNESAMQKIGFNKRAFKEKVRLIKRVCLERKMCKLNLW